MQQIALNMYQTAAIAMMLFVLGRFLTNRIEFLKKCCIPAPVVGGLIFAIVHLCLYMGGIGPSGSAYGRRGGVYL